MLTKVVDLPNGTGVLARIPGYSVAGKTGTTPKYNPKNGTLLRSVQGEVRVPDVVRRLRAGHAPALRHARDGRRAEGREGPHTDLEGGDVAAPTFKRIAQGILQILRIPPDRPAELR